MWGRDGFSSDLALAAGRGTVGKLPTLVTLLLGSSHKGQLYFYKER